MSVQDQEFLVQKIRTQYTEKEYTELDALKELDAEVKRPANAFAYAFGTAGALVLGSGMSLAMNAIKPGKYFGITVRKNTTVPGIITGVIGLGMVGLNYPIYKRILNCRKKKYANQILTLSDEITSKQENQ